MSRLYYWGACYYHCVFFPTADGEATFRPRKQHRLNTQPSIFFVNHAINTTTNDTSNKTSNSMYWNQKRSLAAVCRCFAPPCLATYSTQNTAFSSGGIGLSLNTVDIFLAFFRYLRHHINERCNKLQSHTYYIIPTNVTQDNNYYVNYLLNIVYSIYFSEFQNYYTLDRKLLYCHTRSILFLNSQNHIIITYIL